MTKKIILEFHFDEVVEFEGDDPKLKLVEIRRAFSELTTGEIDALGEEIGQTDTWQLDRWTDIQAVLGEGSTVSVHIDD